MSEISASSSSSRKAMMVLRSLSRSTPQAFITRAASGSSTKRKKEMLQRRQLVLALVGLPESVVDCGFQGTRERGHSPRPSGLNPPALGADAGMDSSVTHHLLNFGFILRASRVDYAAPWPKRKKIAVMLARTIRPCAAPAQKASLRRRTSAKTWASGKFSRPSRALNPDRARAGTGLSPAPGPVAPAPSAPRSPHRGDLRRPRSAAPRSPRPPTGRSERCSRHIRGRNRPACRPAAPPACSGSAHICSAVPSNSRPQPITIRLSAENSAPASGK